MKSTNQSPKFLRLQKVCLHLEGKKKKIKHLRQYIDYRVLTDSLHVAITAGTYMYDMPR